MSRLPRKLRVYAGTLGGAMVLASVWVALAYDRPPGSTVTLVLTAALGAAVAVAPIALAYGKRALEHRRHKGLDQETYASAPVDVERPEFVVATRRALAESDAFEAVKERSFREGTGLIVDHTAFHGTFIRLTTAGRVVVTGVRSRATRAVVDQLESRWSTSFAPTTSNPFVRPIPVRGASRVFLALVLTAVVAVDLALVAGVAYPSPAYNHGEKAALLGYDAAASAPGISRTDADLAKADFLVTVLREEATEIRWAAGFNDSEAASAHDAEAISGDVSTLLTRARSSDPGPEQQAKIDRIEAELGDARRAVRAAIADVENGTVTTDDAPFSVDVTPTAGSE